MTTATMMLARVNVAPNVKGRGRTMRELRVVIAGRIVVTARAVAIARRVEDTGRRRRVAATETGVARKGIAGERGRQVVASTMWLPSQPHEQVRFPVKDLRRRYPRMAFRSSLFSMTMPCLGLRPDPHTSMPKAHRPFPASFQLSPHNLIRQHRRQAWPLCTMAIKGNR